MEKYKIITIFLTSIILLLVQTYFFLQYLLPYSKIYSDPDAQAKDIIITKTNSSSLLPCEIYSKHLHIEIYNNENKKIIYYFYTFEIYIYLDLYPNTYDGNDNKSTRELIQSKTEYLKYDVNVNDDPITYIYSMYNETNPSSKINLFYPTNQILQCLKWKFNDDANVQYLVLRPIVDKYNPTTILFSIILIYLFPIISILFCGSLCIHNRINTTIANNLNNPVQIQIRPSQQSTQIEIDHSSSSSPAPSMLRSNSNSYSNSYSY